MDLQRIEDKSVVLKNSKGIVKPVDYVEKKVLDENTYTKDLEKIIERDFFPDLPRMKAQTDYLEALQNNDTEKLREIHIKYGPKRPTANTPNIYATPATFETPDQQPKDTPKPTPAAPDPDQPSGDEPTHNPEPKKMKTKEDSDLPLDKYLAKNTSEDNASFVSIMHENEVKHRQKHVWLYEQEEEKKKDKEEVLALPSIEKQAIMPNSAELQTWNYQAKNSLMYVPDGAAASAKEKIEEKGAKPREVVHPNTRFKESPFNMEKSRETIQQAASEQALAKHGKIGHDGKEILPEQSPQVNGYGFIGTPSPAPGVDESPLMTWGEIEGTPFRLDGGDTPGARTPGPTFRIPEVPKRDRIGLNLAEEVGKAHRAKKKEALKRVTACLSSPSPKFGMSKTERLNSMSPAAQRLASSKLGIRTNTDKALRASYTPSPSHRLAGDKTPIQTTPSPRKTPKSGAGTPKTLVTPKRNSSEVTTLTDNLLNLPIKRKKAEDFF